MKVAHILRKLDPAEWSGTETAIYRLFEGLRSHGVEPTVFCPRVRTAEPNPIAEAGFKVREFDAFVPVLGLTAEQRRQLISVGGNLMSFNLISSLWREPNLSVIHTHTLGRIGGIALTVARRRQVPFVVSIHGGVLDLPDKLKAAFNAPSPTGWEWGKFFGLLFQSHKLFKDADAILTCNSKEASLLQQQLPAKKIVVQPHGVPLDVYSRNCRESALQAFPRLRNKDVLLCLGRIDPVKNQAWLLEQAPALLSRHPNADLVVAGPCTDEAYGEKIRARIRELGLGERIALTGAFPADDPRMIGLLQLARTLILPSLSETFGLVILEAWAAGTMVISANASGPAALVEHGTNGWLFDLQSPQTFHDALDRTLSNPAMCHEMVKNGRQVAERYSVSALAGHLETLYQELIEEKQCVM